MNATTAAAQLRRILQIVPHIADGEMHAIDEVARLADVDRRTVFRDLESLALRFDDPGGFVEGVQIFLESERLSLRSDHFLRPMRLTAAELCALELGLAIIRSERRASEHRAIDRARVRLREALVQLKGNPDLPDFREVSLPNRGAEHLTTLREAFRQGRKVRLRYRKGGDTVAQERVARPFAVLAASGAWYIVAFCEASDGVRIFRLDRIESTELLDQPYSIPGTFSVAELVQSGRAWHGDAPEPLRIRYSPRVARWIAEREGKPLDADGSLTIEQALGDDDWAVRHALQYGPDAEVLGPERIREAIVARLRQA